MGRVVGDGSQVDVAAMALALSAAAFAALSAVALALLNRGYKLRQ